METCDGNRTERDLFARCVNAEGTAGHPIGQVPQVAVAFSQTVVTTLEVR
jgi:hypothetical protein